MSQLTPQKFVNCIASSILTNKINDDNIIQYMCNTRKNKFLLIFYNFFSIDKF